MKDIFNPDSYTVEAMPLLSALCTAINDMGDLDHNSAAVNACIEKYKEVNEQFYNTLTKEQSRLLINIQWGEMEELEIVAGEYFNRGLRFGMLLMKELFG